MVNLALVVRLLECVWDLVSFAGEFLGRELCISCLFNGVEVLEIWPPRKGSDCSLLG